MNGDKTTVLRMEYFNFISTWMLQCFRRTSEPSVTKDCSAFIFRLKPKHEDWKQYDRPKFRGLFTQGME